MCISLIWIDLQDYNLKILCAKFGESSMALENNMQVSRVYDNDGHRRAKLVLFRTGNTVIINFNWDLCHCFYKSEY